MPGSPKTRQGMRFFGDFLGETCAPTKRRSRVFCFCFAQYTHAATAHFLDDEGVQVDLVDHYRRFLPS